MRIARLQDLTPELTSEQHISRVPGVFGDAGFRPGSRGPFVSAKGPKTISARARPRWGSFVPGQIKMANNSLRSNRFAREPYLARDSAAPKAGILYSVVIPAIWQRESIFPLTYFNDY